MQFIGDLRNCSCHAASLYSFASVKEVRPFTINGEKDNEEAEGNEEKNAEENWGNLVWGFEIYFWDKLEGKYERTFFLVFGDL